MKLLVICPYIEYYKKCENNKYCCDSCKLGCQKCYHKTKKILFPVVVKAVNAKNVAVIFVNVSIVSRYNYERNLWRTKYFYMFIKLKESDPGVCVLIFKII